MRQSPAVSTAPVAVCIVTHDDAEDLPACLAALEALAEPVEEIVVVDSASRDASVETARNWRGPCRVEVIALAENLGFAAAMNRAIAATSAPWVLSLNADARLEPDFLVRLLERAASSSEVRIGALTGRLLRFASETGEGDLVDACGMRLTWTWRHLDRAAGQPDRGQHGRAERVFGGTGAATLYRREALEDVAIAGAVFDERFHSFREDAELAFRLHERGWEVIYEPAARARHRRRNLPERRRSMSPEVNFHSLKNRYLLRVGHQTAANFFLTFLPATARDLAALVYVALREPSSRRAYAWLWQRRSELWRHRRVLRGRRSAPAWAVERWFFRSGIAL